MIAMRMRLTAGLLILAPVLAGCTVPPYSDPFDRPGSFQGLDALFEQRVLVCHQPEGIIEKDRVHDPAQEPAIEQSHQKDFQDSHAIILSFPRVFNHPQDVKFFIRFITKKCSQ